MSLVKFDLQLALVTIKASLVNEMIKQSLVSLKLSSKQHNAEFIIGFKHDFYAFTSARPQEWCINLSLKGEGFNNSEGSSRFWCIMKPCLMAIIA